VIRPSVIVCTWALLQERCGSSCFRVLLYGLVFGVAAGCGLLGSGNDFDLALKTDKSAYVADGTETIQLSIVNGTGSRPVYFECDIFIDLEELENGIVTKEWLVRGGQECLVPHSIPGGEVEMFKVPGRHSIMWNLADARFDESVDYQLRASLYTEQYGDHLIPLSERVSNRFRIERP